MSRRVLYQFTLSPYCIKIRRALDYKGLAYQTVEVNPFHRREVMRLSGQKRVPVLADDRDGEERPRIVADSTAILEYLDQSYPVPPIYPSGAAARARTALLEEWADEAFASNLVPFKVLTSGNARRMVEQSKRFYPKRWYYKLLLPLGPAYLKRYVAARRRGRSLRQLRQDYERDLDNLDRLAQPGPFLLGESPTAFDFAVWGLLRTMEGLSGEELLARRVHLARWYSAVGEL